MNPYPVYGTFTVRFRNCYKIVLQIIFNIKCKQIAGKAFRKAFDYVGFPPLHPAENRMEGEEEAGASLGRAIL